MSAPTLADVQQSLAQQAQQQLSNQALTSAAQIGLTALGAGVAGRGLTGLLQQLRQQRNKPRSAIPAPIEVEIPVEEVPEGQKLANTVGKMVDKTLTSVADTAKNFAGGGYSTTAAGVPWSIPLWTAAAVGGLGGGWKLTDWLMDKRRKQQQRADFEAAKSEYHDALYGKAAAAIDQLYDALQEKQVAYEKASSGPSPYDPGNLAGITGGMAATWAGGSGLLAALATYQAMKKRQRRALLSDAQKQRRRQRYEAQPTPVYATPVPVSVADQEPEAAKPFRAAPSF